MLNQSLTIGPFTINAAQYTLVYRPLEQVWELRDIQGTPLGTFTRRYLHENALGQKVWAWRETVTGRQWGTDPRTAMGRWLAARQGPGVAA